MNPIGKNIGKQNINVNNKYKMTPKQRTQQIKRLIKKFTYNEPSQE